jgi:hypothetical protein
MNIERFRERFASFVAVLGGIVLAILCGKLAGSGQFNRLGAIFTVFGIVAVCVAFRARVWLLIPLSWPLGGVVPLLEWPFAVRDLGAMIAFGGYLFLMGVKAVRENNQI